MQCACWSVWRLCHRIQLGPWPYFLLIYSWALGPLCFPLKMTCFFPNDNHTFFWSLHFPGLARKTNLMEHKKQPLWPKPRETNLLCIHSIPTLDKEVDEEKAIRDGISLRHARAECLSMPFGTMWIVAACIFLEHLIRTANMSLHIYKQVSPSWIVCVMSSADFILYNIPHVPFKSVAC